MPIPSSILGMLLMGGCSPAQSNAAITQTVLGVLRNQHTQRINFNFANINITPNDFTLVAQAIEQGRITVMEGGVADGMAKYTAADEGNSKANTMYVGKNTTSQDVLDSLLVHEAVHAVFDLRRTFIPWLDNEMIAYIAQGFYLKNAGVADVGRSQPAILGQFIAESYPNIDQFFVDDLRNSLLSDPTYHGYIRGNFQGDG
jgi:hypothetical protein